MYRQRHASSSTSAPQPPQPPQRKCRLLSGLPSYSKASGAGAHRAPVMDVPEIKKQQKFLQNYENVEVPQIPSSTECFRFQLYYRGEYVQCKLCKSRRFHSAFLVKLFTRPLLCNDRCLGLDSAEKLWRFCSCSRWRLLSRLRRWCWSRQYRKSSRFRRRSSGQGCWFSVGVQKLRRLRSCSSSTSLVHVPVVMQRLVPMVQTVLLVLRRGQLIISTMSFGYFLGPEPGGRVHRDTAA